jgi:small subunit ribosomal protein S16
VVKVRLRRAGRKGHPCYSVVVADSCVPRDGKFLEKIGTYQPMLAKDHPSRFLINAERLNHWFGCGAHPTDPVVKLLVRNAFPLPGKIQEKWNAKAGNWLKIAASKREDSAES